MRNSCWGAIGVSEAGRTHPRRQIDEARHAPMFNRGSVSPAYERVEIPLLTEASADRSEFTEVRFLTAGSAATGPLNQLRSGKTRQKFAGRRFASLHAHRNGTFTPFGAFLIQKRPGSASTSLATGGPSLFKLCDQREVRGDSLGYRRFGILLVSAFYRSSLAAKARFETDRSAGDAQWRTSASSET
jgi:hypothetical protein